MLMNTKSQSPAVRVSICSICVNLGLTLLKLLAGIFAHSGAMISDAVHSASDVFSTFIVLLGIHLSNREPDSEHRYGHERMESLAAVILALLLALTGIGIGYSGIMKIVTKDSSGLEVPGIAALLAAIVSIVVKEIMFHITRKTARQVRSDALMADAWHHRSDALSSIGSLIGIGGAMLGFPVLDPLASVVICIFILKAAFDIAKSGLSNMMDTSCDEETLDRLKTLILQQDGVQRLDDIKTRMFGSKFYVDVEISVDGMLPLWQAHAIAEQVHHIVEETFTDAKHCMVHVNPYQKEEKADEKP